MPDSPEPGAPAPTGPDAEPQVEIALGPDLSLYPENLRPTEPSAAPPEPEAPEPAEASVPETEPEVAGAAETRGTRRRAAEDAYQRGLAEGRAALESEQAQRQQQDQVLQTRREANERIKQLFDDLRSSDYATQDRARRDVLQLYDGNQQGAALMIAARQQVLQEMAADFGNLKNLDGLQDGDYEQLFQAPSAVELAKRAMSIGSRGKDEQIARLEAELQGLRGRLVGSRATPEAYNGAPGNDVISIEQYRAMSPKEAARLSSAQINALTTQMAADAAAGR
jgi:hypothetical protein